MPAARLRAWPVKQQERGERTVVGRKRASQLVYRVSCLRELAKNEERKEKNFLLRGSNPISSLTCYSGRKREGKGATKGRRRETSSRRVHTSFTIANNHATVEKEGERKKEGRLCFQTTTLAYCTLEYYTDEHLGSSRGGSRAQNVNPSVECTFSFSKPGSGKKKSAENLSRNFTALHSSPWEEKRKRKKRCPRCAVERRGPIPTNPALLRCQLVHSTRRRKKKGKKPILLRHPATDPFPPLADIHTIPTHLRCSLPERRSQEGGKVQQPSGAPSAGGPPEHLR